MIPFRHLRAPRKRVFALVAPALALVMLLGACGTGNASTPPPSATSTVHVGNAGTLIPGQFKWGEDSTGGMPYIVPKDANNPNAAYYGYEVDIANAMAKLMGAQEIPTQITWSNWQQGLASQQFDFFMNGLEITSDNI